MLTSRKADPKSVEEELHRRVDAVLVAPPGDQEVHGNEDDLEEEEEHQQVEGHEDAEAPGLEQQHPTDVVLDVLLHDRADDGQREEDAGQDDEPERDAVDAELPGDAELADPVVRLQVLEAVGPGFEVDGDEDRDDGGGQREEQADEADEPVLVPRQHGHEQRPGGRDDDERGEQRERDLGPVAGDGGDDGREGGDHRPTRTSVQARRRTTPPARPRA
jgi:hypothetical protein